MGGGARREIRPLRARRALQSRGARRLHQDRPPRLAVRHAACRRHAGPRRLSASRVQSGAGYLATDRGAQRRAARPRQRPVPGLEPRIHLGRCRQHGRQCDPRPGAGEVQHPLQRSATPRKRCAHWSSSALAKACGNRIKRAHRVGAFEFQRVRDQARRLHRSRGRAIEDVTGPQAGALDTSGGTSDARFISSYCPVIEFGLVGQTMHQIDERTPVADLEKLTKIYRGVLDRYFA